MSSAYINIFNVETNKNLLKVKTKQQQTSFICSLKVFLLIIKVINYKMLCEDKSNTSICDAVFD